MGIIDFFKQFFVMWILGFILTLPRFGRLEIFQRRLPIWLQRVLFIKKREFVDSIGVVWQVVNLVAFIVIASSYGLGITRNIDLVHKIYGIICAVLFTAMFLVMIIEVVIYQRRKRRLY